jgi:translation initiation factor 1
MNLKIKEGRNPKNGKPVTIISEINHNPQVIEKMASELKSKCGTGGYIDGKKIVLNGSQIDKVTSILEKDGFTVTRL